MYVIKYFCSSIPFTYMVLISDENFIVFLGSVLVGLALSIVGNLWVGAFFKLHQNDDDEKFQKLHDNMKFWLILLLALIILSLVVTLIHFAYAENIIVGSNQNRISTAINNKLPSYPIFEVAFSPYSAHIPLMSQNASPHASSLHEE